jgi:DNA excision repair protein ERCC-2
MSSVSLGRETLKRARSELEENGNLTFPTGGSATELIDAVIRAMDEVVDAHAGEEDGILPPHAMEDAILGAVGGTSHAFDTMLGTLAQWGEALRESRRRERKLPRSSTHAAALALLSWPQLEPPEFVKVVTRSPRVGIEAYAVDARSAAAAVRECHTSIHLSGTLAPIEEYRVTLGLPEGSRTVSIPSPFPPENRRSYYDPDVTSRQAALAEDETRLPQMVERLGTVLASLPVRTAVFFPSFALLDKALAAGLRSVLPAGVVIEEREQSTADLWRAIDGFKRGERDAVLVGVAGGRIAEGIDFPDDELEAVVLFGLPFPRPTARREALRRFLDATTGRGWEYTVVAPTRRAIAQAIGRMIRSDKDRGLVIVLDHRATDFPDVLTELAPLPADLPELTRAFYARPA